MFTKAIIFDADGMIVHGERMSDRLHLSPEVAAPFFNHEFQRCIVGKSDLKQEVQKYLSSWNFTGSVDDLFMFWFDPVHNRIDERFGPVITELRARGIKAYIATNNEKYRTENLFEKRGLGTWFDQVFSSAAIGFKKPQSEFFQRIFKMIPETEDEVLFWDDDIDNVKGARSFGLRVEQYRDFGEFKKYTERSV